MDKILVAIDFSESAQNTLDHAAGVAKAFNANLIMLWIENSKSISHLGISKTDNVHDAVNERFNTYSDSVSNTISKDRIETIIDKGDSASVISKLAKELKISMIVIGTHGAHGFKKYLMGSNANKVLATAPCPVITIRPNRDIGRELNVIVVPIDSGLDTRQKLPLATLMARRFDAEIHILALYFSNVDTIRRRVDSYSDQAQAYAIKQGVKNVVLHKTFSKDGARTIINYAKKVDAGLIAVMIDAELGGSSWSLGSQAKQFVNQSPIPILNVANKELIRTAPKM